MAASPPATTGQTSEEQLIKALAHPIRAKALTILNQRVASPKEVALELGEEIGNVSYHVKQLRRYGCVELVRTAQRRGATEHYYRGTARPFLSDSFWARLPDDVRNGISVTAVKVINDAVGAALEAGTFDARPDRHLSCVSFDLDEEGWDESRELLKETLEGLMAIGDRSAARGDGSLRASFGILGFESPS
jgi:DNA-binding transcriptional ArsR family regulator